MSEQDVERMATFGYYADEQCRVMAPDGRIVSMAYSQASAQRFADELNKLSRRAQSPVSGEREADDKSVETMCSLPSSLTEHVCGSMPAVRRIKHYWRVECACGLETAKCSTEAMAVQVWVTANPLRALAPRPAQAVEPTYAQIVYAYAEAAGEHPSERGVRAVIDLWQRAPRPAQPVTEAKCPRCNHGAGRHHSTRSRGNNCTECSGHGVCTMTYSEVEAHRPAQTGNGPTAMEPWYVDLRVQVILSAAVRGENDSPLACEIKRLHGRIDALTQKSPATHDERAVLELMQRVLRGCDTFEDACADIERRLAALSAGPAPLAGKAGETEREA